jgi:hypothetical protein
MYQNRDYELSDYYLKNWYAKRDIKNDLTCFIDVLNIHMRDQLDSYKYSPHLWAYDFEKLENFKDAGFCNVEAWNIDERICNPERIKQTLYVRGKNRSPDQSVGSV